MIAASSIIRFDVDLSTRRMSNLSGKSRGAEPRRKRGMKIFLANEGNQRETASRFRERVCGRSLERTRGAPFARGCTLQIRANYFLERATRPYRYAPIESEVDRDKPGVNLSRVHVYVYMYVCVSVSVCVCNERKLCDMRNAYRTNEPRFSARDYVAIVPVDRRGDRFSVLRLSKRKMRKEEKKTERRRERRGRGTSHGRFRPIIPIKRPKRLRPRGLYLISKLKIRTRRSY